MEEVDSKAKELQAEGCVVLSGPGRAGDGYYEFETLHPGNNRIEVTAKLSV
ncbi:MAG: glyoxalase [Segetibacter sp.]|nr:glyoxalase [Segetibacter sp.]